MVYTEVKERNNRKYYYRVLSVRNVNKISKRREYLGVNLNKNELKKKESEADKILNIKNKIKIEKNIGLFLNDISESMESIESFSKDLIKNKFMKNRLHQDAIIKEIEIISEAIKNIPDSFKGKHPYIKWKKFSRFGDILIDKCFEVDLGKVWNFVKEDLSKFKKDFEKVLKYYQSKK